MFFSRMNYGSEKENFQVSLRQTNIDDTKQFNSISNDEFRFSFSNLFHFFFFLSCCNNWKNKQTNKHSIHSSFSSKKEPPMFKISPQEYYVASLDDDVTMSCEGMGQPKPKISWRRVCISKFFSSLQKTNINYFRRRKRKRRKW